jgi:DNA-binding transcriptional ArsR family regulator
MSKENQWTPAPMQIVSDLGQLSAFGDPDQSRILRILQRLEVSPRQLAQMLGMSPSTVETHLQRLCELVLVRPVESNGSASNSNEETLYRATARMFNLRPEPRDMETISSPVATAMLGTLERELKASITVWPDQKLGYEGRRTRLPMSRVVEFDDRLAELIREFWGDEVESVDEDPDDPLMAFMSVWYRLPG